MKRLFTCAASTILLCATLCGCGSFGMGNEEVVIQTPGVSPIISPLISPDLDNGTVEDRDGVLEDEHRSPETGLQTEAPTEATQAPTATAKP